MPNGYLVSLGDSSLDAGDVISGGLITFTTQTTLGAGQWVWSGTYNGTTYTNEVEPGVYYVATNGNVYFVPDFGAVDTLSSATVTSAPAYSAPDGAISGTAGDDIIDAGFTGDPEGDRIDNGLGGGAAGNDDIIEGLGGNDSISGGAGNDFIVGDQTLANDGQDTISGGDGNDTIYGDTAAGADTSPTVVSWANQGLADETSVAGGTTATSADGTINVQVSVAREANFFGASVESNDTLFNYNSLSDTSSLAIEGGDITTGGTIGNNPNAAEITLDFSAAAPGYSNEVENVTFGIHDIDELQGQFIDQVTVTAYDADGNTIPVTVVLGSTTTLTSTANPDGSQTVEAVVNSGGSGATDSATGFAQFSVAGPVSYIEIDYNNTDPAYGGHAIRLGDVQLTAIPEASEGGNNDTLFGDAGNDVIYGQGGDDSVDGGIGSDTIFGGDGNDTLAGGNGSDTISGDAGADTISGGRGVDSIQGGTGDDNIDGGSDTDTIDGNEGNDTLSGGAGDDVITDTGGGNDTGFGGDGSDTITLGAGADTAFGGTGTDSIFGGADNDVLSGGAGADTIQGGTGDDTVYGDGAGEVTNLIVNGSFENLTGTTDTAYGSVGTSIGGWTDLNGGTFDLHNDGKGGTFATDGDRVLDMGGSPNNVHLAQTVAGVVPGEDYALSFDAGDVLGGGNAIEVYWGGQLIATVDPVEGGMESFAFTVTGGAGDGSNRLEFREIGPVDNDGVQLDNVQLIGAEGSADSLSGGDGNDTLFGGDGADSIAGDAGADTLYGGTGADTQFGGDGDDVFVLDDTFGDDEIFGGEGAETIGDVLDASNVTTNLTLDLSTLEPANPEAGTLSDGVSTATFQEIEIVLLGAGDDSVTGSSGDDIVATNAGSDTIDLGTGDDQLDLGLNGGGPDGETDVIVLQDGSGSDTIFNFDAPTPDGSGGFTSGDLFDVTALTDDLGNPVYVTDVTVTDDGSGNAVLSFPNGESVTLVGISPLDADDPQFLNAIGIPINDGTVSGTAGDDTIDASYVGDIDGDLVDNNDAILPGDTGNDDLIEAGAGNDTVVAGLGNDEVFGGTGDDLIEAGSGDDTVFGEAGDDEILLGSGTDTGFGGDGDDTFQFSDADGTNVIVGGETGEDAGGDVISSTSPTDVVVTTSGDEAGTLSTGTTTVDFSEIEQIQTDAGNDTVDLSGDSTGMEVSTSDGDDSVLGGSGDDFVDAGTGNDTVDGGAGNDEILGGDGDDQITGGAGDDSIDAGQGSDSVILGDGFGSDTIVGGEDPSGTDTDTLDASAMTSDVTLTLSGAETGTLSDGANTATFSETEVFSLGDGNDTILAGTGDDTVYGGGGRDTFVLSGDFGNDTLVGGQTGDNFDTLDLSGLSNPVSVVFTGPGAGTITDAVTGDVITFSEIEKLILTEQSDVIDGTSDNGYTLVETLGGDDVYLGSDGNDIVDEELGVGDGSGSDTFYGGGGDDILSTGDEADTLFGGTGADTLNAQAGDDTIYIADGDTASGDAGDDLFIVEDLGETTNGDINIDGGSGDEIGGDTLQLGGLGALTNDIRDTFVDDGTGSYSGSITLNDGTVLNFSEIENIICFTPGTRIATPLGPRDIADLKVGDLVVTRDHGLQPIRWIESRRVPGVERFAPVRIRKSVLMGQDRDLLVSPQHRVLFQGYRAELLFGEREVLVAAKHLVDGIDVTQDDQDEVTYIHMLFDEHEIIYAEGAPTESFHPGDIGFTAVGDAAREELFTLFPDLRADPRHYGTTARRCLKKREAALIRV